MSRSVTLTPEEIPFFLVVLSLAVRDLAEQVGVREERGRAMRERAPMEALAPAHAVAELEIPVGRHLGCRGERLLAGGSDDEFPWR